MKCNYCGSDSKNNVTKYREEFKENLCWKCYQHYKEHPINKLPPLGVVNYDDEGRVVCHICGRAYDRLSAHLIYKHKIHHKDYRELFGLNRTQKLTSERHSKILRESISNIENIEKIRYTELNVKGCKHPRYGKKERLQAKLNRKRKQLEK